MIKKGGKYFNEQIRHFSCGVCNKWWSVGDAPEDKEEWYCPWCGEKQVLELDSESHGY